MKAKSHNRIPWSTSIRWRIIISYAMLILISLAVVGFYLSNVLYQTQLQTLQDRLTDDAFLISDSLANDQEDFTAEESVNKRSTNWANMLGVRVTIISKEGIVLGESHQDTEIMDNHLSRPEIQEALLLGVGSQIRYSQTIKFDMLYVAAPIFSEGKLGGFVRVALPLKEIQMKQAQLRNTILLTMAITASLGVIVSIIITLRITQPLQKLTQVTELMTQSEITHKITSSRQDEVGKLTQAFNALVEKLNSQISALQSEQEKLASVLKQMTDGVVIVDDHGKILLINIAAERLFNIKADQALENSVAQVLRHHQWVELWEECKSSGQEQSNTLEIPHLSIFIQGIALQLGDALPNHVMMIFQDLTRIRRLETVRRDFISNISHELRTPLASLKALVETLSSGALEDPPAAKRFLYHMETEVDTLIQMVSELLELSRIESRQVPLKFKSVKPKKLLTKAHERLIVQAERNQLIVNVDCPKNLPPVRVDKSRLGQVLVNLLHNAIKFTSAGGEIALRARQQEGVILFSVQDTGKGIPADELPRVFERFYKTDPARSGGGTGLGLAIARHLVEAHKGKIWVESVEGQGSTFFFTIPIGKE